MNNKQKIPHVCSECGANLFYMHDFKKSFVHYKGRYICKDCFFKTSTIFRKNQNFHKVQ